MSATMPDRVLSNSEVEGLKDRVRERKAEIKGDTQGRDTYVPRDRQNDPLERESINRSERLLKNGDPRNREVTRIDRNRYEARRKQLIAWFEKHMVPRSHIDLKASGDPEFRKTVSAIIKDEMSQEFKRNAIEFKNISRMLYPGEPSASNLETIRPATR